MNFTPQQDAALTKVTDWLGRGVAPFFYLAGYAGTGKTTLAKYLAEGVGGEVFFAAFTGKAASVLRAYGCPGASTLHSLLYSGGDDIVAERIKALRMRLTDATIPDPERQDLKRRLADLRRQHHGPSFTLNPESPVKNAALLVLDEVSMINDQLAEDALSFGVPILVLGDPAQLPPVRGTGYFTQHTPDHLLTEIHRQAADNPIIHFSMLVREGCTSAMGDNHFVRRLRKGQLDFETLPVETQVLTGKNVTRRYLNVKRRRGAGRTSVYPVHGDKLVCLKNDRDFGFLNGVICWAASDAVRVDREQLSIDIAYEGRVLADVPVSTAPFDKYTDADAPDDCIDRDLQQFDYGYALTVHKSQGSQWDHVVLADDGFGRRDMGLRTRWLYTAVTRAAETLTIVE